MLETRGPEASFLCDQQAGLYTHVLKLHDFDFNLKLLYAVT